MSILIVYASRNGTTEKAAAILKEKIGQCDIVNIAKDGFDLSKYDTVIIGSNIKMGMMDKKIRRFVLEYIKPLTEKNVSMFVCCCFAENTDTYFSQNIPPQLLEKVSLRASFGGELDVNKLHGADKMIAKMVTKADREKGIVRSFGLDMDAIDSFATKVNILQD